MGITGCRFGYGPDRSIEPRTNQPTAVPLTIRPQEMRLHPRNVALVCAAILISTTAALTFASQPAQSLEGAGNAEILFVQAPSVKAGRLPDRFPQGSRIVLLSRGSSTPKNLTPSFFAAADPRISFDGSRVLFAGEKENAAAWQIWEMRATGAELRQVTHCNGDCLSPAYLPLDHIAFTGEVQGAGGIRSYQIFVSKSDGSDAGPITFGPGNFELETVLKSGLILVSASSPLKGQDEVENSRNLYTVRIDGSGLASLRCDHQHASLRSQAEEIDDGSVVFVKNMSRNSDAGGELAEVRRGSVHNSILNLANVVTWSPRRLEAEKLIVARRVRTPGSAGKFDLYSFDPAEGKFLNPIYKDSELSSIEAVPVAAHPAPRWYWSTLSVEAKAGYFICLDASLSADAPKGRLSALPSEVRVLALDPATRKENNLGEAAIERDGSFYIAVPPDRPVRFELLGAGGKVVHAQQSWVWARPGEEHGCVGCHEDRAVAPENRWPLALRRFDTPNRLGVEAPLEAAH